jgi:hypothetical protein
MSTSFRSISVISGAGALLALLILSGCADLGDAVTRTDPSLPGLSITDVSVAEGDTAYFVVSLSSAANGHVVFDFATADSGATVASDYVSTIGTDTIHPGETFDTIRVATINDADPEPAEKFKVILSTVEGAALSDPVGIGTIEVSDGWVGVSFATQIKPLLDANCLSCHGLIAPSSNFSVISHQSVLNSGDRRPNVIPYNGAQSLLYRATTVGSPIDRMPQGGPYLSAQQQQLIKDWIDQGATDN